MFLTDETFFIGLRRADFLVCRIADFRVGSASKISNDPKVFAVSMTRSTSRLPGNTESPFLQFGLVCPQVRKPSLRGGLFGVQSEGRD